VAASGRPSASEAVAAALEDAEDADFAASAALWTGAAAAGEALLAAAAAVLEAAADEGTSLTLAVAILTLSCASADEAASAAAKDGVRVREAMRGLSAKGVEFQK
jgi:hypothetical protein